MWLAAGKAISAGKIAGINNRNAEVSVLSVEGVSQRRFLGHHKPKDREKWPKGGRGRRGGRGKENEELSF